MSDESEQLTPYERKLQIIVNVALRRFDGNYSQEEYDMEVTIAKRILTQLGVRQ